jgi:IclR family acetate operon transcriptional repressor
VSFMASTDSDRVGSVERALKLLDYISTQPESGLSLADLTKMTKYSKSSILALLRTLVDHGYLRTTNPGPRYLPGLTLIKLGDLASSGNPVAGITREILTELTQATTLTSRIAINDGGFPVVLSRIDGPGTVRFFTPLGVRELPHITSAGKAILATMTRVEIEKVCAETDMVARTPNSITSVSGLLANLELVRKVGYALDDEEDALGVFCIGSAFFDHSGNCAGAISVTGLKSTFSNKKVEQVGRQVFQFARKVTVALGGK